MPSSKPHKSKVYITAGQDLGGEFDVKDHNIDDLVIVPRVELIYRPASSSSLLRRLWKFLTESEKKPTLTLRETIGTPESQRISCDLLKFDNEFYKLSMSGIVSSMNLPVELGEEKIYWLTKEKSWIKLKTQDVLEYELLKLAHDLAWNSDSKENIVINLHIEKPLKVSLKEFETIACKQIVSAMIEDQVKLFKNLSISEWKSEIAKKLKLLGLLICAKLLDALAENGYMQTKERIVTLIKGILKPIAIGEYGFYYGPVAPDCIICKETFVIGDSAKRTPCLHHFHEECIAEWIYDNRTCAFCGSDFTGYYN
ncbi:hypothetical protein ACFE04_031728 [Oxalis oulophora]